MKWLTFSILILLISCAEKTKIPPDGQLVTLVGDVNISGKAARIEMNVPAGSEIVTGSNSYTEIVFNKKNIIRIMENSDVILNLSLIDKILVVKKGSLESVMRNLNPDKKKDNSPFKIESSTAAAAVRGTTFFVMVDNHSNTAICVCNGVLNLGSPGETNRFDVSSCHHSGVYFTKTSNGFTYQTIDSKPVVDNAEMKKTAGHNDLELEDLAGKIGEKIDWTKIDKKD